MAVAYWNLILTERFKFLDLWNRFLLVRELFNVPRVQNHVRCQGSINRIINVFI